MKSTQHAATELPTDLFEQFLSFSHGTDDPVSNLKRAASLGLQGENIRVAPGAIIRLQSPGRIGANCFIGLYSYINGNVVLEDHVIVGPHCSLTASTHVFEAETRAFTGTSRSTILVGRGTWICAGCTVTSGVSVGKGNLVCANAVVTKNSPDFVILAGIPARVVGSIDPGTGTYNWLGKNQQ